MKRFLHRIMNNMGFDIIRYKPNSLPDDIIYQILSTFNINVVLDVGASDGGYAKRLRNLGYKKRIISFEPINKSYMKLMQCAKKDINWQVHNYGLGNENKIAEINLAANYDSSSLLKMLPTHSNAAPHARYFGKEKIEIKKIDDIFSTMVKKSDNIYLKIDVQGYEHLIIEGGKNSLNDIDTIQLELSLVPLYEGQLLFDEIIAILKGKGYTMIFIEPGFRNKTTGQLLQFDGIFHRYK